MNRFLKSSDHLITRHGLNLKYFSITSFTDPVTRITTKQRLEFIHKIYPKQLIANQYNFPNLIGKDSVMFYIANANLGHAVSVGDEIEYKGLIYRTISVQETVAHGEIVLWRVVGSRG